MKSTPFTDIHIALGAKMHEFAGYNMPIEYSGINDEHLTVRTGVGVFDVSHMGEIWVKGPKALDLIQKLCSNDASKLNVGQAQYSCFPNGKGGIVDDILVYYFEPEKYMLVVNASNVEKDWNWLNDNNTLAPYSKMHPTTPLSLLYRDPKLQNCCKNLPRSICRKCLTIILR